MIRTDGPWFKDEAGRTLTLRGVNLGGSSKVPVTPNGATHLRQGFFDHRNVSFVDRPFPIAEADEHFRRLQRWGMTFLRLLTTWEAIEHEGPGRYDQAYLDYLEAIVRKAGEHGLRLFIDPHQDVWSRFCGGDGAPGWTLEAAGLDLTKLQATGAAIVHQLHGDPFPRMIWPTNAGKLAAATMFTLFFGGSDFAPGVDVDGEPIQEYLQRHYIDAVCQVAHQLSGLEDVVVGYDTMNEPWPGYIGWCDLNAPLSMLRQGPMPSPLQAMALGAGVPVEVPLWTMTVLGPRKVGLRLMNPERERAWSDGRDCIWRSQGVWDVDAQGQPHLSRPDHFSRLRGKTVSFARDYYKPFANRFIRAVRAECPATLIFLEHDPFGGGLEWGATDPAGVVFAPHWYDGYVLYTKSFNSRLAVDMLTGGLVIGRRAIRRSFAGQLAAQRAWAAEHMGGVPVVLGEFGIPFDLNGGRSYTSGDFSRQAAALERCFRAVEDNLLSCTLWNYTADNTNARGDQWNGEDLSIFSRDQQEDPASVDSGGRALQAAVRPYPRAVAGEPLLMGFDSRSRVFRFTFRHDPGATGPTEVYLPSIHYGESCHVTVSDGTFEWRPADQLLVYRHTTSREVHEIEVRD